jgi:predicted phosphodiesterase
MTLALAALLLAAPAGAEGYAAGAFFDGARGAAVLDFPRGPRRDHPPRPKPPTREETIARLVAARARFGHEAQEALIPPRAAGEAFAFVALGDGEPGRFFFQRLFPPHRDAYEDLLGMIASEGADFTVQLGDFVSRGKDRNYLSYAALLERAVRSPLLHVTGNHDRAWTNKEPQDKTLYRALIGEETDRIVDRGAWRFVLLDDSDSRLTDAQLDWLDAALDTDKKTLVFMHIPPAYLGKRLDGAGGEPAFEEDAKPETGYFNAGAERFREIVTRRKPARVYMGHIHAYGAVEDRGVCYVLSGAGGSPVYPAKSHAALFKTHYLRVDLSPEGVREELVFLDGGRRELPAGCPVL